MEKTHHIAEPLSTNYFYPNVHHASASSTHSSSSSSTSSRQSFKRSQNPCIHKPVTRSSKIARHSLVQKIVQEINPLRELIAYFLDVNDMQNVVLVNRNWKNTICVNNKRFLWCTAPTSLLVFAYVRKHLHSTKKNPITYSRLEGKQFINIEQHFKFKITCRHFPEIHHFATVGESTVDADLVGLACLTKLQSLNINLLSVTDAGLQALSGFTWVKDLSIGGPQITDVGLHALSNLTGLQNFSIACEAVTDLGLSALKGFTELKKLSLHWCTITDAGLAAFTGLTALRDLSFTLVDKITATGLAQLSHLRLEKLKFSGFFPKYADELRCFTTLQSLTILNVPKITDSEVGQIGKLTTLRNLSLCNCRTVYCSGQPLPLSPLRSLTGLQKLRLASVWIKDHELKEFINLPHWKALRVKFDMCWHAWV